VAAFSSLQDFSVTAVLVPQKFFGKLQFIMVLWGYFPPGYPFIFMESHYILWLFTVFIKTSDGKKAFQHIIHNFIAVKILCLLTF